MTIRSDQVPDEENPLLKKKPKIVKKDPLDCRLDRPLTAEELSGFGKQTHKIPNVTPFIKVEKNKGLCPVVGVKVRF